MNWLTIRYKTPREEQQIIRNRLPWYFPDLWMTRQEAADELGVHVRTVDRLIRERKLTGTRNHTAARAGGVRVWKADVVTLASA